MSPLRDGKKIVCRGLGLAWPVDLLPDTKWPILTNVRAFQEGRIEARPGEVAINATPITGAPTVHSIRRLNDDTSGSSLFSRIVGAGASLYYGTTSFSKVTSPYTVSPIIADVFSGNPLAMVPFRPEQSPQPWMYVADSNKLVKVRQDGRAYRVGILPPLEAPSAVIGTPVYNTIDRMNVVTGWTVDTVIFTGVATLANRVNTTITAIKYDAGTTGWAIVQPDAATGIEPGVILNVNGGSAELVVVEETHPAVTATTVGSIAYDSGTSGLCSITPASSVEVLEVNSMLFLNSAEYVRVLSVTRAPDGSLSFRCSTTGTIAAGQDIVGVFSFRARFVNTHAATGTVQTDALRITAGATAGTGVAKKAITSNMLLIGTRQAQPEDDIHMSLRISDTTKVSEVRILFNVDTAAATTALLDKNYYFYAVRPSDLTSALRASATVLTAREEIIRRRIIDDRDLSAGLHGELVRDVDVYGPDEGGSGGGTVSEPVGGGEGQWLEIKLKVKDLTRVGSDSSRTLANVRDLQVVAITSGACTIDVNALWLGGSYGPDVGDTGEDLIWRYRGRNSETGAKSNPSPAMRTGIRPRRQPVALTATQMRAASDVSWAQVDRIDFERWGGANLEWHYVGTVTNDPAGGAGSTVSFTDTIDDGAAVVNQALEIDSDQPFTLADLPKAGTCFVAGTTVTRDTGDTFSVNWAPGTIININGVNYTLYNRPRSTSILEITENGGTQNLAVSWNIYEPKLLGQGLPTLWGPFDGFMFSCGDYRNPGRLYFTKGNDPDAAPESNYVEVTSPSEPLMNGFMYFGRAYVFSSERLFAIYPDFLSPNKFVVIEVPNSKGLISRWAFAVGPKVRFVSKDGVYETEGGEPQRITGDLYPLFPHDGIAGVTTNGYNPPDYATQAASFRLCYYDSILYFDFIDTAAARRTLPYDTRLNGWFYDSYAKPAVMHYGEEGSGIHSLLIGSTDGVVYQSSGTSDAGTAIAGQVRTRSVDLGDERTLKLWGDTSLDLDRDGATITVVQGFNQHGTTLASQSITTLSGRQRYELPTNSNAGQEAYNASLDFSWSSATAVPKLYYWEYMAQIYPAELRAWQTIATSHGLQGYQHLRDAFISIISSADVTLLINMDGTNFTYTIASTAGAHRKVYVPFQVMKGKSYSYRLSSASTFRFFPDLSEIRVRSWGGGGPYVVVNPFADARSPGMVA